MKRKALAITLAAVMAMGTCAVTASAADGDKYTIGICQLVQHDALDAATQGFKDEVTALEFMLFRLQQPEQAIFRFLVLLLQNMVLHSDLMISTEL